MDVVQKCDPSVDVVLKRFKHTLRCICNPRRLELCPESYLNDLEVPLKMGELAEC